MSASTSSFISDDGDGIKVYVEHGDLDLEIMEFMGEDWCIGPEPPEPDIEGLRDDEADDEIRTNRRQWRQWRNPTLRYWKKHQPPKKPNISMHKRAFRFTPSESECLLGPEAQYVTEGEGNYAFERRVTHDGCACQNCDPHRVDWSRDHNFWDKVAGPVKVNV